MISVNVPLLHFVGGTLILFAVFLRGDAIKCWECNSHTDPSCGDPFNNNSIAATDCDLRYLPHYPNTPATICRKIIQKVNDEYRYIRGCGWMTDDRDGTECIKRAGTFHVFVQYCSCGQDFCNLASIQHPNWLPLSFVVVISALMSMS